MSKSDGSEYVQGQVVTSSVINSIEVFVVSESGMMLARSGSWHTLRDASPIFGKS